jgi:ATP-binding cassette subfamily B protein
MQDVAQFAIMDTEFDVPCSDLKPITAAPVAIQFDGVCFTYNERTEPIYTDLNLQIRTGERVGFVGHSGSGKSTAIKLMQRMYSPQMGTVKILGNDAKGLRIAALRRSIAVTGQEPIFFNRSIRENIAYGCESADLDQIRAAAQLAMIDDVIVSLPNGYDTAIGERGLKLSGGERQRIAIARACLSDAQILVFDEATSQVDAETEAALQDKVWSRLASKTIVVVAHRLSQVRNLDRILVFDKGGIAEEGNHETLIARRGLYHRMVMRQSVAQC